MMDNEIVAMFYHCLSNVDRNLINFDNVAAAVGEATAGKAYVFRSSEFCLLSAFISYDFTDWKIVRIDFSE